MKVGLAVFIKHRDKRMPMGQRNGRSNFPLVQYQSSENERHIQKIRVEIRKVIVAKSVFCYRCSIFVGESNHKKIYIRPMGKYPLAFHPPSRERNCTGRTVYHKLWLQFGLNNKTQIATTIYDIL